jgi:hypothetical protein
MMKTGKNYWSRFLSLKYFILFSNSFMIYLFIYWLEMEASFLYLHLVYTSSTSSDNLIKIFLNSLCRTALLPPPQPPPPLPPLLREWNHPLMAHLDTGTVLPQDPGNLMQIANSTAKKPPPLMSHLNSMAHLDTGTVLPQDPSNSMPIANSMAKKPPPLMSHLNSEIFLPQDPSISREIANSRTNIGSESGLSAEVNYLSENPLMLDQLVSAAPSLDHPNQNYLGTPMDDDWEKIFYE